MTRLQVFTILTTCFFAVSPTSGQFGKLPDSYLLTGELKDIKGEMALEFLSDWAPEIDSGKFGLATSQNSKFIHILGIADIGTYSINDPSVKTSGKIAFWWIPLQKSPEIDSLTNNGHVLQMKFWASNKTIVEAYKTHGLDCEIAEIKTEYGKSNVVFEINAVDMHLKVTLKNPESEPEPINYELPAYTKIWTQNSDLNTYQLITYFGHKVQHFKTIDLELPSENKNRFLEELKKSSEHSLKGTLQSNWKAKFAVYPY